MKNQLKFTKKKKRSKISDFKRKPIRLKIDFFQQFGLSQLNI